MASLRTAILLTWLAAEGLFAETRGEATSAIVRVAPGELGVALENAQDGDHLQLEPGVHPGPLTIEKRLVISGGEGVVIDGGGHGTTVRVTADGVQLCGLTIRGSGADLSADDAVVLFEEVERGEVRDCQIEARAFGIYLRAGSGHQVVGNVITGDRSTERERRGNGIHLWHTSRNQILANQLVDVRDGIYLSFAHDNRIESNNGEGLRYGIHYMYSERNELSGNRFDRSVGGFALMYSMNNVIRGNRAAENERFGILCLQLEGSTVRENVLARNGRGLFLENSANNDLTRNSLLANGVGVYLTAGSEANSLWANDFDGNVVQVYARRPVDNRWSVEGLGNYWSDYRGFDWNGDGVGDTPYRLETTASALLARYPAARWFWSSPLLALLDWWQSNLLSEESPVDSRPLVTSRRSLDG